MMMVKTVMQTVPSVTRAGCALREHCLKKQALGIRGYRLVSCSVPGSWNDPENHLASGLGSFHFFSGRFAPEMGSVSFWLAAGKLPGSSVLQELGFHLFKKKNAFTLVLGPQGFFARDAFQNAKATGTQGELLRVKSGVTAT